MERDITNYMIATGTSSPEAVEAAKDVVRAVHNGRVQDNLLLLIQQLGEYLTSDDDFVRAKATGLLSTTLRECEHTSINGSAVSVLVDFYCNRLTEKTCVPYLLDGLLALTDFDNFSDVNAVTVAKRLFERVEVQRFPQGTRNSAFQLFENLLSKKLAALRSINDEFIYGFTQAMDGEKDPRNLLCAFKLVETINREFDISIHVEDLFEVTFCYFPITFKPPPDDPYGITAEDLKVSLRKCLASTPLFAKFAVPLMLEKLSSTSGSAKKDSMETLAACAPVYGAAALLPNTDEIMDSLKVEVLHATDASLEEAALDAIHCVVAALSSGVNDSTEEPTDKALKPIVDESLTNLKDPDLRNAKETGRILRAAASASDYACNFIVSQVLPRLLSSYRETEVTTHRKLVMDIMLELLEAGIAVYGSSSTDKNKMQVDEDMVSPLLPFKDRLFYVFENALMASNEYNGVRLAGIRGFKLMTLTQSYLSSNEVGIVVQSYNKILLHEPDDELRMAVLDALTVLAQFDSSHIIRETVPALIQCLPETAKDKPASSYQRILVALKKLAPIPAIFDVTAPMMMTKMEELCRTESEAAYPCAIATCLLDILKIKVAENHTDIETCVNTILPRLIADVIQSALDAKSSRLLLEANLLRQIAFIVSLVFQKLNTSLQEAFVTRMFKLFLDGDLSVVDIESSASFAPLSPSASDHQKPTLLLFSAIVCACRKDTTLPLESVDAFCNQLMQVALVSSNTIEREALVTMMGAMVNKYRDTSALSSFVETSATRLEEAMNENSSTSTNALEIYLWLTKALVVRAYAAGYELTQKIIHLCSNPVLGLQAAKGFDILIGEDPLTLNKATFATINILYKQRFFNFCLPELMGGFRTADEAVKPNYLIALSYMLKHVPKQILFNELPPLVPLLIQALTLQDATLKVSTLDTFRLAVTEASDVVAPHVRSILPALLGLLEPEQRSPLEVRIAALKCLAVFPVGLTNDVLLPHVHFVTKQLTKSLDDKKRLVRKEAVDCRARWYSISVPL
ncbi:RNAPII transcription regulator C-terminal-domain-containing protein [Radiomyces spectabilis]|uniref:RNAPII transcription regulator C-terminal-domain-containing protein n=1 Tax=Radiomyces spectabilis TaxID=64574 RepID=UPI0022200527|nr:RNAPII transcription regulator C-terminal-domain-containing protein [Radiomyces spectabilis]KAI8388489.1 RNAPII transcription regulator C-terminal-domain-containing protein [Radiomyces spectabilis]